LLRFPGGSVPLAAARRPVRARPCAPAAALALAALAAAGCAPERTDDLFGMNLEVRSQQAWASDPALRSRVHDLVEQSCAYLGLDPDLLYGMTLRIEDGDIACGTVPIARGCTWRGDGVISVSTLAWLWSLPPVPCVEDTPIPHELLHVKIGDDAHTDPRWGDPAFWGPLWTRVSRADCSGEPAASIW
jgi:hypothetical protein